jgi:hypothetical protein
MKRELATLSSSLVGVAQLKFRISIPDLGRQPAPEVALRLYGHVVRKL